MHPHPLQWLFLKLLKVDNLRVMMWAHHCIGFSSSQVASWSHIQIWEIVSTLVNFRASGWKPEGGPRIPAVTLKWTLGLPKYTPMATLALILPRRWKKEFPGKVIALDTLFAKITICRFYDISWYLFICLKPHSLQTSLSLFSVFSYWD